MVGIGLGPCIDVRNVYIYKDQSTHTPIFYFLTLNIAPHQLQHRVVRRRVRLAGERPQGRQQDDGAGLLSVWFVGFEGWLSIEAWLKSERQPVGLYCCGVVYIYESVRSAHLPAAIEQRKGLEAAVPLVDGNAACWMNACVTCCLYIDPSLPPH